MTHHLHCPNKACLFSKAIPYGQDLETHCPTCSTQLILDCPACKVPLANKERGYCSFCGASTLRDLEEKEAPNIER